MNHCLCDEKIINEMVAVLEVMDGWKVTIAIQANRNSLQHDPGRS